MKSLIRTLLLQRSLHLFFESPSISAKQTVDIKSDNREQVSSSISTNTSNSANVSAVPVVKTGDNNDIRGHIGSNNNKQKIFRS